MISHLLKSFYIAKVKWIKLKRMFIVPKGQKVIDIGGGNGPFPRADVLCEKFLGDDTEREGNILYDRPLVMGDLEALPFRNNSFDFVYCSHILEHAHDPAKAISEIQRIAKKGYIEVPSAYLELAATSTPTHLWTIERQEKNKLLFRQKKAPTPNPEVDRVFRQELWGKDSLYEAFHWKNYYRLFNIGILWDNKIEFDVVKSDVHDNAFSKGTVENLSDIRQTLELRIPSAHKLSPRKWIKKAIQRFFTDARTLDWLWGQLACPACSGDVKKESTDKLVCHACQMSYPIVKGVPILLKDHGAK